MNTQIRQYNSLLIKVLIGFAVLLLSFALSVQTAVGKDMPQQPDRITISIGVLEGKAVKDGKLETRRSGESFAPRLKITPVETAEGRIRVIVPLGDLSEGTNIISVPARVLDSRGGETGGKLQTR